MGSVSSQFPDDKLTFFLGAIAASYFFFFYWDTEPDIYSHSSTALKLGKY
jgi:arginine exporter protein ArgO